MAESPILIGLIGQLRGAGSKLHKLKLLALAWRTLRGLSPEEQAAVASELGMEGAEKLIEQLGRMGGLSPSAVLAAVKRAEQADPGQLRQLLGNLMDGEGRRDVVASARGAVERWLEDTASNTLAQSGGDEELTEKSGALPPTPTPMPAIIAAAPDEPDSAPIEVAPPVAFAERLVPESPPARPVVQRAESCQAMRRRASVAQDVQPVSVAPQDRRLIDRLNGLRSSILRLRELAAAEAYTRRMDIEELREVVESFPWGWARRRALVTLLKAGIPRTLSAALELVNGVADGHTWLWALTALAARDLNATDTRLLIAAADRSPSLKRRIRFLLGAGPRFRRAI